MQQSLTLCPAFNPVSSISWLAKSYSCHWATFVPSPRRNLPTMCVFVCFPFVFVTHVLRLFSQLCLQFHFLSVYRVWELLCALFGFVKVLNDFHTFSTSEVLPLYKKLKWRIKLLALLCLGFFVVVF